MRVSDVHYCGGTTEHWSGVSTDLRLAAEEKLKYTQILSDREKRKKDKNT